MYTWYSLESSDLSPFLKEKNLTWHPSILLVWRILRSGKWSSSAFTARIDSTEACRKHGKENGNKWTMRRIYATEHTLHSLSIFGCVFLLLCVSCILPGRLPLPFVPAKRSGCRVFPPKISAIQLAAHRIRSTMWRGPLQAPAWVEIQRPGTRYFGHV